MRRRLRAAAAGLAMLSAVALCSAGERIEATEAAWTSAQYAAAGTVSAAQLAAPTITSCQTSGLTFSSVTIVWTSWAPIDTTSQVVAFGTTPGTVAPTRTGPDNNGVYNYSVTYSSTLLNSLLGNLLGSSTPISVRTQSGTNWASAAATRTLTVGPLGLNSACTAP